MNTLLLFYRSVFALLLLLVNEYLGYPYPLDHFIPTTIYRTGTHNLQDVNLIFYSYS